MTIQEKIHRQKIQVDAMRIQKKNLTDLMQDYPKNNQLPLPAILAGQTRFGSHMYVILAGLVHFGVYYAGSRLRDIVHNYILDRYL